MNPARVTHNRRRFKAINDCLTMAAAYWQSLNPLRHDTTAPPETDRGAQAAKPANKIAKPKKSAIKYDFSRRFCDR